MRIISHTGNALVSDTDIFATDRKEEEWTKTAQSIPEFYADQEIFITGASGFLGERIIFALVF